MKGSSVEIRLLGQKIALKSQGDPAHVREVIALVSGRLGDAERRLKGNAAPHLVALLALLELAEEYVASRERVVEHQLAIQSKAREIEALFLDSEEK